VSAWGIEQEWVDQAKDLFCKDYPSAHVRCVRGDALALPLEENQFDVVTCQTVLMHVRDPMQALAEMKRVAKPGGLIICVEPINLLNRLEFSSMSDALSIEEHITLFEFWLRYHRGQQMLAKGNHNIGAILPGLLSLQRLENIQVYQNDKTSPMYPDWASAAQGGNTYSDYTPWDDAEILEAVRTSRADEQRIAQARTTLQKLFKCITDAKAKYLYCATGGANLFVVSGRKPATAALSLGRVALYPG
jgi:SAM-dependent methyltransferase